MPLIDLIEGIKMKIYDIEGLSCASCASSAQRVLAKTQGVKDVRVNYATKTAAIEQLEENLQVLNQRLDKLGFKLHPKGKKAYKERKEREAKAFHQLTRELIVGAFFAFPLFVIAMFLPDLPYANFVMLGLTLPILYWSGRRFFISAFKQATVFKVNMDSLIALGTGTAFLFSLFNTFFSTILETYGMVPHVYYEAVGVLLVFVLLGKYLETRARQQTSSAIEGLLAMQVPMVQLLENGVEKSMPIEVIQVGDLLKIRAGERIPLDGIIEEGAGEFNESMLTGEALWVPKQVGEEVWGGTLLEQGSCVLKVTKIGEDTVLSQIITLVEEAQNTQVPIQKLVDKIAAVFVPIVMGIALLTGLLWGLNGFWVEGLVNAVAVLVVACPCALGLATPTAITIGIGEAAKRGILIQNVAAIEHMSSIDAVVLDKTGTITEGKPQVTGATWKQGLDNQVYLEKVLASLENESEHPIAQALVQYYHQKGVLAQLNVQNFVNRTGLGLCAAVEEVPYYVGNKQLLEAYNISIDRAIQTAAADYQKEGKTLVFFADSYHAFAVIGLSDAIKADSSKAIAYLKSKNKSIHMLTGDHEGAAAAIAHAVGIEQYQAQVMPQDKIAFVQQLQQEKKQVMMVGDGINDAPALAQATVGIAMNNGTAVAIQSADVILRKNSLAQLAVFDTIAAAMLQTIRQNLFWAFIYNIVLIPVAAGLLYPWGLLLNPMLAGGAMALSSVFVVMNSLRLKQKIA